MRFRIMALEERIVLDAAGLAHLVDAYAFLHHNTLDAGTLTSDALSQDHSLDGQNLDGLSSTGGATRVLVVSSQIKDAQQLASAANSQTLVVMYDPLQTSLNDLATKISTALGGRLADSIAFANEGTEGVNAGQFNLTNNIQVSLDTLNSSPALQAFWENVGQMIKSGGRIDLLACDVAADQNGLNLVQDIQQLADSAPGKGGITVAASTDLTGNATEGGNWNLEVGNVDAATTYFNENQLVQWDGVLGSHTYTVSSTADSGANTLRAALTSVNTDFAAAGGSTDTITFSGTFSSNITLLSALPVINFAQTGDTLTFNIGSVTGNIIISGSSLAAGSNGLVFESTFTADNVTFAANSKITFSSFSGSALVFGDPTLGQGVANGLNISTLGNQSIEFGSGATANGFDATAVVNSTANSGIGTLNYAINNELNQLLKEGSGSTANLDLSFVGLPTGTDQISLTSALPTIIGVSTGDTVTFTGGGHTGGNIVIDGTSAGASANGLTLQTSGTVTDTFTIAANSNLVFQNFAGGAGIKIISSTTGDWTVTGSNTSAVTFSGDLYSVQDVVSSSADTGVGTLRSAITNVSASLFGAASTASGVYDISFAGLAAGATTYTPATVYPTLTGGDATMSYLIDGNSHTNGGAITISGASLPTNSVGLSLSVGGDTIENLTFSGFTGASSAAISASNSGGSLAFYGDTITSNAGNGFSLSGTGTAAALIIGASGLANVFTSNVGGAINIIGSWASVNIAYNTIQSNTVYGINYNQTLATGTLNINNNSIKVDSIGVEVQQGSSSNTGTPRVINANTFQNDSTAGISFTGASGTFLNIGDATTADSNTFTSDGTGIQGNTTDIAIVGINSFYQNGSAGALSGFGTAPTYTWTSVTPSYSGTADVLTLSGSISGLVASTNYVLNFYDSGQGGTQTGNGNGNIGEAQNFVGTTTIASNSSGILTFSNVQFNYNFLVGSMNFISVLATQANGQTQTRGSVSFSSDSVFVAGLAGTALSSLNLATFTDSLAPTASINWGDTTTSTPTPTNNGNGTYSISGQSHTYASAGTYTIATSVTNPTTSFSATAYIVSNPTFTDPGELAFENTASPLTAKGGATVADSSVSSASTLTLTLTAPTGTALSFASVPGGVTGNGTNAMTITDTLTNINADLQLLRYTPIYNDTSATDSISYTISDLGHTVWGTTLTKSGSFNVNVVNDEDSYNVTINTALTPTTGVLANDTDPFGTPQTATVVSNPTHGTLQLNTNGTFTYTPNLNYVGSDTFTYSFHDSNGFTSPAILVHLNVTTPSSQLADINSGAGSSSPIYLGSIGTTEFFWATNGTNGMQLYKSTGAPGNLTLVTTINATGSAAPFTDTSGLDRAAVLGSYIYFGATDGTNGVQLWRSDGTAAGTTLFLNDGNAAGGGAEPGNLSVAGSYLFFRESNQISGGTAFWVTDGVDNTTTHTKQLTGSSMNSSGFAASSVVTATTSDGQFHAYVRGSDTSNNLEVFGISGTSVSTMTVTELTTFAANGGLLLLTGNNGFVGDNYFAVLNNVLYFAANSSASPDNGLWQMTLTSTGTLSAVTLVKQIDTLATGAAIGNFIVANSSIGGSSASEIYFTAVDGVHGTQLWESNGTAVGTVLVTDINQSSGGLTPTDLTNIGGTLYFLGTSAQGEQLWQTNGTAAGTLVATNLTSGINSNNYQVGYNGQLVFFAGNTSSAGVEPWTYNPVAPAAPTQTLPGAQTVAENSSSDTISGLSITDSNANTVNTVEQITLSVSFGTLTLGTTTGLTVTGSGTSTLTLTSTAGTALTTINTDLGTLKYTPTAGTYGTDTLSSTTHNTTGGDGESSGPSTVGITVTPAAPTPAVTLPGAQTVAETATSQAYSFTGFTFNDNNIDDQGATATTEQIVLHASFGTLSLTGTGVTGNGTSTVTLNSVAGTSASAISTILNTLQYTPTNGTYGTDTITFQATNTTVGGGAAENGSFGVTVKPSVPAETAITAKTFTEGSSANAITGFSFTDTNVNDQGSSTTVEQITLGVTYGILSLGTQTGVTVTGNGTSSLTITSTAGTSTTQITTDLNSLTYTPTSNTYGVDSLAFNAKNITEGTGTGAGATLSQSSSITVSATGRPIDEMNGSATMTAQTMSEAGSLTFSAANNNALSIVDNNASDGGPAQTESVTLSVTNGGLLNLSTVTGLTFTAGANNSSSMTFTGTLANINADLVNLTYTPTSTHYGSDTISFGSVNTNTNDGLASSPATSTIAVTINATGRPIDEMNGSTTMTAQTLSEGGSLAFSSANSNALSIVDGNVNDGGATQTESVTLSVTNGGLLNLSTVTGLTFTSGANNSSSMTFTGTLANINTDLLTLVYTPTSTHYGSDTISFGSVNTNTSDGLASSPATSTIAVTINATGRPIDEMNGSTTMTAQTLSEGGSLAFSAANSNALSIVDGNVNDGGATQTESVTLSVTNGGLLNLSTVTGLTFTSGANNSSSMTFTGTLANINTDLLTLVYTPTSTHYGSDTISFGSVNTNTSDGLASSPATSTIAVTINATGRPLDEMNGTTVMTSQTMSEGGSLAFKAANSNALSIVDSNVNDGGATQTESVTLSVTNGGLLNLSTVTGLTFTSGANNSSSMTFTGTLANINTDLLTLVYTPTASHYGADTISFGSVNTNTSDGLASSPASSSIPVTINAVAPGGRPIDEMNGSTTMTAQTMSEGGSLAFSAANSNALSIVDSNVNDGGATQTESVTLSVGNGGLLNLSTVTGLTFTSGANNSSSMIFTGTLANINADLLTLVYTPTSTHYGSDAISFGSVNTNTNDGLASSPATATIGVTINATVAPINEMNGSATMTAQTLSQGGSLAFKAANNNALSIVDSNVNDGGGAQTESFTLSVTNGGILSLSTTAGLTLLSGANNSTTMKYSGTLANINADLLTLTYTPSATRYGPETISFGSANTNTSDGLASSPASSSIAVTVSASVAPVNEMNGSATMTAQTVAEAGSIAFSSANSNALSIVDSNINDGGGGQTESVTLSVTNTGATGPGVLKLSTTTGLTFTSGANNSSSMTFTGTLANINTDLLTLIYTPLSTHYGTDTISFGSVNTNTNDGLASSPASSSITVTVTPSAPIESIPGVKTFAEGSTANAFTTFSIIDNNVNDQGSSTTVEQLVFTVSSGTLSLGTQTGVTVTGGGTSSLTITSTAGTSVSTINTDLTSLTYTPTSNTYGTDRIFFNTTNITVPGGATASTSVAITVTPSAPVETVPGAQVFGEGSSANALTGLSITDNSVDNQGASSTVEQVKLTVSHGTLSLGTQTGVTVTGGGTSTLTLTSTAGTAISTINTDLASLTYTPTSNTYGTDSLSFQATNKTVTGGATATTPISITVTPSAPVETVPGAQAFAEGSSANALTGLSITDSSVNDQSSSTTVEKVILSVSHGTLSLGTQTGATVTGNGTASLTLTSTAGTSISTINTDLGSLKYTPTSGTYGSDSLSFQATNTTVAGGVTASTSVSIAVTPSAPTETVPGAKTFAEGSLTNAFTGLSITDNSVNDQGSATVEQIILSVSYGTLSLGTTTGLTVTGGGTSSLTLTSTAGTAISTINTDLTSLTYTPTSSTYGTDSLSFQATNITVAGGATSSTPVNITVTPSSPVETVPGAQTFTEGSSTNAFTGLSITDNNVNDQGTATVEQIILSVSHGTLSLGTTTGLTVTGGGTSSLTLTSTAGTAISAINTDLASLTYTPTSSTYGSDSLSFQATNTTVAGGATASTPVGIIVTALAPSETVPGTQTFTEGTTQNAISGLSITDNNINNSGAGTVEHVTLSVSNGKIFLGTTTGLTNIIGNTTPNGSASITFDSVAGTSIATINTDLASLTYTPTTYGSDTLSFTTTNTTTGDNQTSGASTVGITISDALLTAGTLTPPSATEGVTISNNPVIYHFTDADPNGTPSDYVATVTLGDGNTLTSTANPTQVSITSNAGGGFDVHLNNYAYADEMSNKTFSVQVTDVGGAPAISTSTNTFSVADAALTPTGATITPNEGTSFTGAVATFTDADPSSTTSDFTAQITWGDGNVSTGTITKNGSVYTVTGTNTYAHAGNYSPSVLIQDVGGASTTANSTANVTDIVYVTTNSDAVGHTGVSLRDAINQINADFAMTGGAHETLSFTALGGQTINLLSALPAINFSQSGDTLTITRGDLGGSAIFVNGQSSIANGFVFESSNGVTNAALSVVSGTNLNVENFTNTGVVIGSATAGQSDVTASAMSSTAFLYTNDLYNAKFIVNSTSDTSTPGTLRSEITNANNVDASNLSGNYVITFAGLSGSSTITLASQLPGIANAANAKLTIDGSLDHTGSETIDGHLVTGVQPGFSQNSIGPLEIDNLTITGFVNNSSDSAILNAGGRGALTLLGDTITGNTLGVQDNSGGLTIGSASNPNVFSNNTTAISSVSEGLADNISYNTIENNTTGISILLVNGTISNNTISNNGTGILLSPQGRPVNNHQAFILANTITNNGIGISKQSGGYENIGDGTAADANIISGNTIAGISITGSSGLEIYGNSIFDNGYEGDIYTSGTILTPAPVLTSVSETYNGTGYLFTITGTLSGLLANTAYDVQFYDNASSGASATNGTGNVGEGQYYIGNLSPITTNSSGSASFSFTSTTPFTSFNSSATNFISATATPGSPTATTAFGKPTSMFSNALSYFDVSSGTSFTGNLLTIADSGSALTATINWGDGTSATTGTIINNGNGTYTVDGTHTYTGNGTYTVTVTANDSTASIVNQQFTTTADVLQMAVTSPAAVEGAPTGTNNGTTPLATIYGLTAGQAAATTATINWGDGQTTSGVSLVQSGSNYLVESAHAYAEAGNDTISISLWDGSSNVSGAGIAVNGSGLATVTDASLAANSVATFAISSNTALPANSVVATLTDSNTLGVASDFTQSYIDWGDGSSHDTALQFQATGTDGQGHPIFNVVYTGNHIYTSQATFNPVIHLIDNEGSTATATDTVITSDAPLTNGIGYTLNVYENTPISTNTVIGTFTDTDPNGNSSQYSGSIVWENGSPADTNVSFVQIGIDGNNHPIFNVVYTGTESFPVGPQLHPQLTIQDSEGSSLVINDALNIQDATLTGALTVNPSSFVEGGDFIGAVANFGDADPSANANDYSATINWGDGTQTSGNVISDGNGGFNVTGEHTYSEETNNLSNFSVTINDNTGGNSLSLSPKASLPVNDAPIQVLMDQGDLSGAVGVSNGNNLFSTPPIEGNSFNGVVAVLTDANSGASSGDFTATINWGDNTSSNGTVVAIIGQPGKFAIVGTHTYVEDTQGLANEQVSVTVNDNGGASNSASTLIAVTDAPLTVQSNFLNITEGNFNGQLTSFTDADPNESASHYTATINWGDGTSTSSGVISGSNGNFSISGSHAYEEGSYVATVTVQDPDGSQAQTTITVNVADASLSATGQSLSATEETAFNNVVVATFTDANPNANLSDFSAAINWGDGGTAGNGSSAGTIIDTHTQNFSGQEIYAVEGSHTYAEESSNPYSLSVFINDVGGSSVTASAFASVGDAPFTNVTGVAPISAVEGNAFTATSLVSFTDPAFDTLSDYTVTINWGDFSSSGPANLVVNGNTITVYGSHSYSQVGNYSPSITLSDHGGYSTTFNGDTVNVTDAPLTAVAVTIPSVSEGQTYNGVVAEFTDGNLNGNVNSFSASINWNDGSSASQGFVSSLGGGLFEVQGSHTFAAEGTNLPITITVNDQGGASLSGQNAIQNTITVNDVDPTNLQINNFGAIEGSPISGNNGVIASFSDPGGGPASDFTAVVQWGDGTTSTISGDPGSSGVGIASNGVGGFNVYGTHTYTDGGLNGTMTVTINDVGGGTASTTHHYIGTVINPTAYGSTINITNAVEGAALSNSVVAQFTDPGSLSDFANGATINWGDNTSSQGTVVADSTPGVFDVIGSHTYIEESPSSQGAFGTTYTPYEVNVSLTDTGGGFLSINDAANITVQDASLSASSANASGTEGTAINNAVLATFTDTDPNGIVSDYLATISWGDSTSSSSGTIVDTNTQDSNGHEIFQVTGSHTYADEGSYTPTITIQDTGGSQATANSGTVTIGDAIPVSTGASFVLNATEGTAINDTVVAQFTDPGDFERFC